MNEEELFCKLFPEYAVNGKPLSPYFDLFESGYEQAEKRIEELEKKISVLLSCKNCPENKGGYICQKEYEDKCLTQKIQYIKELQEENEELKADNDARKFAMAMSEKVEKQLRNERNTFLAQNEQYEKDLIDFKENLTKATDLLKQWLRLYNTNTVKGIIKDTVQFLKEMEK